MESKLHLDRLYVKNFRALDELTLESLGRVNVFVGRNNSGKSTILDAVNLLMSAKLNTIFDLLLKITNTSIPESKEQDVDLSFLNLLFSYQGQELILDGGGHEIKISKHSNGNVVVCEIVPDRAPVELFTVVFNARAREYALVNSIIMPLVSFPSVCVPTFVSFSSELELLWADIQLTGFESNVINALKILDNNIEAIAFKPLRVVSGVALRKAFVKKKNIQEHVLLSTMGDGMSRVLQIVLSLLNAKDGILLIDEMENGLHYRIQEDLWRMVFRLATELNVQVFVTTHSWDVIESFSKIAVEHPEEGVLYSLGRSGIDGKLNAHRYSEERLYQVTQSEMEVR